MEVREKSVLYQNQLVEKFSHWYDNNGNITTMSRLADGVENTTTYTYDALNRLKSETATGGDTTNYTFDANGNISLKEMSHAAPYEFKQDGNDYSVTAINHSVTYAYDGNNRLLQEAEYVMGESENYKGTIEIFKDYTYDANGNMVKKETTGQVDEEVVEYGYTALNQLKELKKDGVTTATYGYDGTGMRAWKNVGGKETKFYWDRGNIINEGDAEGIRVKNYFGQEGIIGREENGSVDLMIQNARGDVAGVMDNNRNAHVLPIDYAMIFYFRIWESKNSVEYNRIFANQKTGGLLKNTFNRFHERGICMNKKLVVILVLTVVLIGTVCVWSSNEITAQFADYEIFLDGTEFQPNNSPVVINDRTYLPVREIAEALGMTVEWSEKEQKIIIHSKKALPVTDGSDLVLFQKDSLYGYMDMNGKIKIKAQFDYAYDFSEGYATVEKYDPKLHTTCSGVIDIYGNVVIPFAPVSVSDFREGLAVTYKSFWPDESYFVAEGIDESAGEVFIDPINPIEHFYIHKNGKDVFGKTFLNAYPFSCGLALVQKTERTAEHPDGTWSYIDKTGNYATDMEFDYAYSFNENGYAIVRNDGKEALINTNFDIVIDYGEYEKIQGFSPDGYAVAVKDGKYGIINLKKEVIIDFEYDDLGEFSEGLCTAQKGGKWGYIDISNNTVIPFNYKWAGDFQYGFACVGRGDTRNGIINKDGEYVLEPIYESVSYKGGGIFCASKEGSSDDVIYLNTQLEKIEPHD